MVRSFPLRPWRLAPLPWPPAFGSPGPAVGQGRQAVDTFLGHDDHTPAVPPVAPVGTTLGDITLAAEATAPVTAVAGRHLDLHAIDKHGPHRSWQEFCCRQAQGPATSCSGPSHKVRSLARPDGTTVRWRRSRRGHDRQKKGQFPRGMSLDATNSQVIRKAGQLPMTLMRRPLRSNITTPSVRANSV